MAQNLDDYLATHHPKGFRSVPHYFAEEDFVTYYLRNDPCYAERADDIVTVYLATGSKELVVCKIKGVKHILQTAGDFGVTVADGDVQLGLFFFIGASLAREESQRKRYEELRRLARTATLDKRELLQAH